MPPSPAPSAASPPLLRLLTFCWRPAYACVVMPSPAPHRVGPLCCCVAAVHAHSRPMCRYELPGASDWSLLLVCVHIGAQERSGLCEGGKGHERGRFECVHAIPNALRHRNPNPICSPRCAVVGLSHRVLVLWIQSLAHRPLGVALRGVACAGKRVFARRAAGGYVRVDAIAERGLTLVLWERRVTGPQGSRFSSSVFAAAVCGWAALYDRRVLTPQLCTLAASLDTIGVCVNPLDGGGGGCWGAREGHGDVYWSWASP
jgi:hypothetical protein